MAKYCFIKGVSTSAVALLIMDRFFMAIGVKVRVIRHWKCSEAIPKLLTGDGFVPRHDIKREYICAMRKLKNEELGRKSVEDFKASDKVPLLIILDNVRSLNNIGSIFRTADAFLLEGIYLCGISATPPHREIHKTALGATETVSWKYFKETREAVLALKKERYIIIAIEQAEESIPLNAFQPDANKKYAVIFGHEITGVSDEIMPLCNTCIEVPQSGFKHSLNIAVCAGIVSWHFFTKIKKV